MAWVNVVLHEGGKYVKWLTREDLLIYAFYGMAAYVLVASIRSHSPFLMLLGGVLAVFLGNAALEHAAAGQTRWPFWGCALLGMYLCWLPQDLNDKLLYAGFSALYAFWLFAGWIQLI